MFVEQTSVDLSKNKFENITLVWDMNKLFEEFIFELIRRKIPECKALAQKPKRLLKKENVTRRDTRIDILIQKPQVIIDTKYKKFTDFDDITSADIYQVTTYCLLHKYNRAILLYPQFGNEKPDIKNYHLNNDGDQYRIDFCTINLKYNDLKHKDTQEALIKKLRQILEN